MDAVAAQTGAEMDAATAETARLDAVAAQTAAEMDAATAETARLDAVAAQTAAEMAAATAETARLAAVADKEAAEAALVTANEDLTTAKETLALVQEEADAALMAAALAERKAREGGVRQRSLLTRAAVKAGPADMVEAGGDGAMRPVCLQSM